MFLRILKIRGHSLFPDFQEGDYILVAGFPFPSGNIRVGDVVVLRQPGYGLLVKRVHWVLNDGGDLGGRSLDVRGTRIDSTDSRDFGPVLLSQVEGRVIWHFRKKGA